MKSADFLEKAQQAERGVLSVTMYCLSYTCSVRKWLNGRKTGPASLAHSPIGLLFSSAQGVSSELADWLLHNA